MKNKFKKVTIFKKIANFFNKIHSQIITQPFVVYQQTRAKIKFDKKTKKDFEKQYGRPVEEVQQIMYYKNPFIPLVQTDYDYYIKVLLEGKKNVNTAKGYQLKYGTTPPFFYEPEMCDIHNENLNNPDLMEHDYLRHKDTIEIRQVLKKQRIVADEKYVNTTNSNETKINRSFYDKFYDNSTAKLIPFNKIKTVGEDEDK